MSIAAILTINLLVKFGTVLVTTTPLVEENILADTTVVTGSDVEPMKKVFDEFTANKTRSSLTIFEIPQSTLSPEIRGLLFRYLPS